MTPGLVLGREIRRTLVDPDFLGWRLGPIQPPLSLLLLFFLPVQLFLPFLESVVALGQVCSV